MTDWLGGDHHGGYCPKCPTRIGGNYGDEGAQYVGPIPLRVHEYGFAFCYRCKTKFKMPEACQNPAERRKP